MARRSLPSMDWNRSAAQATIADTLWVLKNAAIAFFRHGEGDHVSRQDGLSRIDINNDRAYYSDYSARRKNLQSGNGGAL